MAPKQIVYWDANCFLGFLKKEDDKIRQCLGVTELAQKGKLIIVTSAITLIEVVKLDNQLRLDEKSENTIRAFFNNPYIDIHNVDREVGIIARDLIWKHAISQRDAIHIATALRLKLKKMHTFDIELYKLSNKHGDPKLKICQPDLAHQMELAEYKPPKKDDTTKTQ
ncbi:MAG: type II toxin-antitoxin system VapC family toxin [Sedimentisphaerales bacterium]|jgi:predicted nucleic acid-binding protein